MTSLLDKTIQKEKAALIGSTVNQFRRGYDVVAMIVSRPLCVSMRFRLTRAAWRERRIDATSWRRAVVARTTMRSVAELGQPTRGGSSTPLGSGAVRPDVSEGGWLPGKSCRLWVQICNFWHKTNI